MAVLPSASLRRRGCCFGPPEAACILTFSGSRWRLWGEQDGVTDVTHRDPAETYSAACWGPGSQRVSLGCSSGRVQVWDPHAGELVGPVSEAFHAVVGGTDAGVVALAASQAHRAAVFAGCSASPEILEIGVLDGLTRRSFKGGKAGICQLAACGTLSAEWLLSAGVGTALRLWRLVDAAADEKPRVHAKLAGPANPATCLDVSCVGDQVISACADGAMQIDVFCSSMDTRDGDAHGTPVAAAFVLSCHEQIQSLRIISPASDPINGDSAMKARAGIIGFGSSMVAFWSFNVDRAAKASKGTKTLAPQFTLSASELGGRVLCARGTAPQAPMVLAFGPLAQPAFAKVTPPLGKEEPAKVEPLSDLARGRVLDGSTKARESAAEVKAAKNQVLEEPKPTVLGPLEATVARRQPKRKRQSEVAGRGDEEDDGATAKRAASLPEGGRTAAGGLSVAPMVRQGLRSKDSASISKVLQTADRRVIDSTVAQLSGHEAFDLLQQCALRLMRERSFSQTICAWMQRVLLRHCAFISSRPLLQRALQPLHDIFEARCSTHRSLVLLRGRLQTARDCGRQVIARQKLEQETVRAPLLEYVEGDEDLGEEATSEGAGEVAEESADALDSDDDLMDEWLDLEAD